MRKVSANSIVLLKNEGDILPLDRDVLKKIAVIGPNANAVVASGGGSASLRCAYVVTPLEGILSALPKDVEVAYHEGCAGKSIITVYITLPLIRMAQGTVSFQCSTRRL